MDHATSTIIASEGSNLSKSGEIDQIAHITAAPSGSESSEPGIIKISQTTTTIFSFTDDVVIRTSSMPVRAYSQSFCLEDFKIVSEKSSIFSVLIDNQQIDFSSDALELSLAGRWMLVTYRYSYWKWILVWLWQGFRNKGATVNALQLKERESTSGRAFDIVGGSRGIPMYEEDLNETLIGKLLLLQHDGWKWKYIQQIAASMSCWARR